jgi:hypothetical protein
MWTIARTRAAGVLFALAILFALSTAAVGSQVTGGAAPATARPGSVPPPAGPTTHRQTATTGSYLAGDRHQGAGGPRPDSGRLGLPRHAPIPGVSPERRDDPGGHGVGLAAAIAAAVAAAVLLGVPAGRRARRCGGRRGGPPRGSRAPPRLLSA